MPPLVSESRCSAFVVVAVRFNPATPSLLCRSMFNFMTVAALERQHSCLGDDASATSKDDSKLCLSNTELQGVETISFSSTAPDESSAGGVSDKRRQTTDMEGGDREASPPGRATGTAGVAAAPVAAAAAIAPGAAPWFAGAVGGSVGNEQHPRGAGVGFGFGPGAGSAGSITASSITSSSDGFGPVYSFGSFGNDGFGPVSAGDTGAVTAAPSTTARQNWNRSQDQQGQRAGDGVAPLPPLLPLMPSAQTSSTSPGPAEEDGNDDWNRGLDLLRASEFEGAEAVELLHAVDELLAEAMLEEFGEGASNEDMLPVFDSLM